MRLLRTLGLGLAVVAGFASCEQRRENELPATDTNVVSDKLLVYEVVAIEKVHSLLHKSLESSQISIYNEYSSFLSRVLLADADRTLAAHLYLPYSDNNFEKFFNLSDPLGWKRFYEDGYMIVTDMDGIVGVVENTSGAGGRGMVVVDSLVCSDEYKPYFVDGEEYSKLGHYLFQKFVQGASEFRSKTFIENRSQR